MSSGNFKCKEILLSSFSEKEKKDLIQDVESLPGGRCTDSPFYQPLCSFIVCKFPSRGEKYLCGCAAGKPLLTASYIKDCIKARKWLNEETYLWYNQANCCRYDENLFNLPRKCKEYMRKNNGKLVFADWKVILHVTEKAKRNAYMRLLQSGGATILKEFTTLTAVHKFNITHAFVSWELSADLKILHMEHFKNIFYPEYITEYLIQPTPPLHQKYAVFKSIIRHTPIGKQKIKKENIQRLSPRKKLKMKSPRKVILSGQRKITDMFQRDMVKQDSHPSLNVKQTLNNCTFKQCHKYTESVNSVKSQLFIENNARTPSKTEEERFDRNNHLTDQQKTVHVINLLSDDEPLCHKEKSLKNVSVISILSDDDVNENVCSSAGNEDIFPSLTGSCEIMDVGPNTKDGNDKQESSYLSKSQINRVTDVERKDLKHDLLHQDILSTDLKINDIPFKEEASNFVSSQPCTDNLRDAKKGLFDEKCSTKRNGKKRSFEQVDENEKNGVNIRQMRRVRKKKMFEGFLTSNLTSRVKERSLSNPQNANPEIKHASCVSEELNPPPSFIESSNESQCQELGHASPILQLDFFERTEYKGSKYLKRVPFSRRVENMVESNADGSFRAAYDVIKDNVTSFYYPSPKILLLLFQNTLDERNIQRISENMSLLQNIFMLHPAKEVASVYDMAFQKPFEEKDGSISTVCPSWTFVFDIFGLMLMSEGEEDESSGRSNYACLEMIRFLISLMQSELNHLLSAFLSSGDQKTSLDKLRKSLLWRLVWESNSMDCFVNQRIKELLDLTFSSFAKLRSPDHVKMTCQYLMQFLQLIARCISFHDKLTVNDWLSQGCINLTYAVEIKYEELISHGSITSKVQFLSQLQPSWLLYKTLDYVLSTHYTPFLPESKMKTYSRKPLSIEKIIMCYFFLIPNSHVSTGRKTCCMTTPLKEIKNKCIGSRTQKNLNKRNLKGESQLQVACIKNIPGRVKELLHLGLDPNTTDHAGWTALHEVSNFGYEQCLDELLTSIELDVFVTGPDGITALHDAVGNGHVKVTEKLLRRGGEKLMMMKTNDGKTAMDLARTPAMRNVLMNSEASLTKNKPRTEKDDVILEDSIYASITKLSSSETEEYMFYLLTLLKAYASCKTLDCDDDAGRLLLRQSKLLGVHLERITQSMTLKTKFYLKTIERILHDL